MNFYSVLKYVLTALFVLVVVVTVLNADSPESATPQQQQPQTGSKFNF